MVLVILGWFWLILAVLEWFWWFWGGSGGSGVVLVVPALA